ncbi:MAG TPA: hypothetical protein VF516_47075 [Kofleriaceae bacterium]
MTKAPPVVAAATEFAWPKAPYKGLNYYGAADHPLFAGRENDIVLCARSLGDHETRLMLLHGLTGCGKSSFLRAGLIPYLEGEAGGFQFLRDVDPGVSRALFVRSTHAPLQHIAKTIYEFASRGLELRTPRGPHPVDLTPVRLGHTDLESFCDDVSGNVERMHAALAAIGDRLPRTLVLVVDQGEEVLTLRPGKQGDGYRAGFFQCLAELSQADLDLRVVVALRTEYYGRFRHELQIRAADPAHIRDFYLATLDHDSLIKAIERPTLETPIGSFGVPWAHYRFSYEPGLSERIATDLEAASPPGGILPAMQIVCERLYEQAQRSTIPQIASADYERLGGADGQIHAHLNDALRHAILRLSPTLTNKELRRERDRWKQLLLNLAKSQVDGSVTTELRLEEQMIDAANESGCKQPFAPMMDTLCTDELRVCRRVEIMRRDLAINNSLHLDEHNNPTVCYCLGHDAIGLTLKQWENARLLMARVDWKHIIIIILASILFYSSSAGQFSRPFFIRLIIQLPAGLIILWEFFMLSNEFWKRIRIRISSFTLARIWRITDKTATTEQAKAFQQREKRALNIYGSD